MNLKQLEIEEGQLPRNAFKLQSQELVEERLIWQHLARRKIPQMQQVPESDSSKSRHK
jgi:hypothetical protein